MQYYDDVFGVKYFLKLMATIWIAGAVLLGYANAQDRNTLTIGGTGSALGGMKILADAYEKTNPDLKIVVLPSLGSGGGINALVSEKIDISLSARPLKPAEQAKNIIASKYARTPVVFATHHDTSVENVGLDELPAIYRGEHSNWSDGMRRRLVIRPPGESDTKLLKSLSAELKQAVALAAKRDDLFVALTDQQNADVLERVRGSFGLTTIGQVMSENRQIKFLSYNGQKGNLENLRNNTYKFVKSLFLVTSVKPTLTVRAFLEFVRSEEGERILLASGFLPSSTVESSILTASQ
ncbi:MAG: ABC transporter substrate-binding protein [Gammaproteobacteria bacterium]|nr:ABC transporter substrate-binding protein [Gammaproteobacteria bacterium]